MTPIVYVETNWIIAYLFPHEQRHRGAKDLLQLAEKKECELRVPVISFIEARGTMSKVEIDFPKELASIRNKLKNAYDAGWTGLDAEAFMKAVQSNAYFNRTLIDILEKLENNPSITRFCNPNEEVAEIANLGRELKLYTPDMKDLYILSSIIVDLRNVRQKEPHRPALFLSHNEKEFGPQKSKVPQSFYDQHRLHYWKHFDDVLTAVGHWHGRYRQT